MVECLSGTLPSCPLHPPSPFPLSLSQPLPSTLLFSPSLLPSLPSLPPSLPPLPYLPPTSVPPSLPPPHLSLGVHISFFLLAPIGAHSSSSFPSLHHCSRLWSLQMKNTYHVRTYTTALSLLSSLISSLPLFLPSLPSSLPAFLSPFHSQLYHGGSSGMWRSDIPDSSGAVQSTYVYTGSGMRLSLLSIIFSSLLPPFPSVPFPPSPYPFPFLPKKSGVHMSYVPVSVFTIRSIPSTPHSMAINSSYWFTSSSILPRTRVPPDWAAGPEGGKWPGSAVRDRTGEDVHSTVTV